MSIPNSIAPSNLEIKLLVLKTVLGQRRPKYRGINSVIIFE